MNWHPTYAKQLFDAEQAVLSTLDEGDGFGDVLPLGIAGPTSAVKIELYVTDFLGGNTRLEAKRMDSNRQPIGDAFDVMVESYTDTVASQRNVDLRQGKSVPGFAVGNFIWVEQRSDGNYWWADGHAVEIC